MKKILILFLGVLLSFTISCQKEEISVTPTTTIDSITKTSPTSVTIYANITNNDADARFAISFSGVCWNTSGNPTIEDDKTIIEPSIIGEYKTVVKNLTPGVTYYFRSYAIYANSIFAKDVGVAYSTVENFNL